MLEYMLVSLLSFIIGALLGCFVGFEWGWNSACRMWKHIYK